MHRLLIISCCLCGLAWLAGVTRVALADDPTTDATPFTPSDALKEWLADQIESYEPEQRSAKEDRELIAALEAVKTVGQARAFFHRLSRWQVRNMDADRWLVHLLDGPLQAELVPLGPDIQPPTIRLTQVTLTDGRVLVAPVRTLGWAFASSPMVVSGQAKMDDQFIVDLGRGTAGRTFGFWIDRSQIRSQVQVDVPRPTVLLGPAASAQLDATGLLTVEAQAFRPPSRGRMETVTFEPRYVESSGGWFVNDTLHIDYWMDAPTQAGAPDGAWIAARRRCDTAAGTARFCIELGAFDRAHAMIDEAAAAGVDARDLKKLRDEFTLAASEHALGPARRAALRGDLAAAIAALDGVTDPAAASLKEQLVAQKAAVDAVLAEVATLASAIADDQRPDFARTLPTALQLDPERCTAYLSAAKSLPAEPDPLKALQRLWCVYQYDLPDPTTVLPVEAAARSWLAAVAALDDTAATDARATLLQSASDSKLELDQVLRIIRCVPWLDPLPSGKLTFPHALRGTHDAWLELPPGYGPWRRVPAFVTHHGQVDTAESVWQWTRDASNPVLRHGMALVSVSYGNIGGNEVGYASDMDTLGLMRWLNLRSNIDCNRMCLTGDSLGGARAWHLAEGWRDRWACAAPRNRGPVLPVTKEYVRNMADLPLFCQQGEFNGISNPTAREVESILAKSPFIHHELRLRGHEATEPDLTPIVQWMCAQRRDPAPAAVHVAAFKAHEANRAWLQIVDLKRGVCWTDTGPRFSPQDFSYVDATFDAKDGEFVIDVDNAMSRQLDELRIYFDRRLVGAGGSFVVRLGRKEVGTWKPRPRLANALDELVRRGDRERMYADSVDVVGISSRRPKLK